MRSWILILMLAVSTLVSVQTCLAESSLPAVKHEARKLDPLILSVDASRDAKYKSIQEAIDVAQPGSVIRVASGTYRDNILIDKPLRLEGAGWENTIITPREVSPQSPKELSKKLEAILRGAKTNEEKQQAYTKFQQLQEKMNQFSKPTLLVRDAQNVDIRGLKFTLIPADGQGQSLAQAVVKFQNATGTIERCVVIGSLKEGIRIGSGAKVQVRNSLVAATMDTGVVVGGEPNAQATISDCDVRNCHYAGIQIWYKCGSTTVERCRISGSAYFGIRNGGAPIIANNLIFNNARSGIYMAGNDAVIRNNLFYENGTTGIACPKRYGCIIEQNTFARNGSSGVFISHDAYPTVRRNIFFGHEKALQRKEPDVDKKGQGEETRNAVVFADNLFWKNDTVGVDLPADSQSKQFDPLFRDVQAGDFSLAIGSDAKTAGIGAADLISLESPWPLQPEEIVIIPKIDSRAYNLWQEPVQAWRKLKKVKPKQTSVQQKAALAKIALLYHVNPDVRKKAIITIAEMGDQSLIDDLIRAHSVEAYTPVHNVYGSVLPTLTGARKIAQKGSWKAWLAGEAKAGRLKIDYIPVDVNSLDPAEQTQIQSFAARLGPEHFEEMTEILTTRPADRRKFYEAMRYIVANDNSSKVQQFLTGNWFVELLEQRNIDINTIAYFLNGLANPGPLRHAIDTQVRTCLESENPVVLTNTLHLLAGVEGFSTVFTISGVEEKVKKLLDSHDRNVALQARRAMQTINPTAECLTSTISYEETFIDLHKTLGRRYPCFELKSIDWKAVGEEFLPRIGKVKSDEQFGLLCVELVARLEDSHAHLLNGAVKVPKISIPQWDPGFACLEDDQHRPVVYYVDKNSPAEKAGLKVGMVVTQVNGADANDVIEKTTKLYRKYIGYSSTRYLRYHAYRFFVRQKERGAIVKFKMLDGDGKTHNFALPANIGIRYLPRLPVSRTGISDAGSISWKILDGQIGYIYVRRIRGDLIELLDKAIGELKDARGLIVDVRGNSGGGFDSRRAHLNFALDKDSEEPERPRYKGPIALLIDSRCISAGEGWASWFVANNRARLFGETTAGASSRKTIYELKNGLYKVRFPVKAYKGYLNRPIERYGLKPDVPIFQNAHDLIERRDTVLQAAKQYLLEHVK